MHLSSSTAQEKKDRSLDPAYEGSLSKAGENKAFNRVRGNKQASKLAKFQPCIFPLIAHGMGDSDP